MNNNNNNNYNNNSNNNHDNETEKIRNDHASNDITAPLGTAKILRPGELMLST